jgi:hypothetical protein
MPTVSIMHWTNRYREPILPISGSSEQISWSKSRVAMPCARFPEPQSLAPLRHQGWRMREITRGKTTKDDRT